MKVLLIDDEIRSLDNLSALLRNYCPELEIVGRCQNINTAYEQIGLLNPAVVFLDVDMPPYTGFDLLRKYEELPFEVIFVTAFDHYSIEAIKFSALYYLLKPIKVDDLKDAIKKAQLKIERNQRLNANYFQSILQNPNDIRRLVINGNKETDIIELDQIIYIEASNSYSTFHLNNDKRITSSKSIKEYEQMLSTKGFFRVHKSFMVNISYVLSVEKVTSDMVILKNNEQIPLAVRRKEAFLSCL
jgi:two-component system LytT family response regulator